MNSWLPYFSRFVVSSNRVIFMIKDGAKAWEIKDFLVTQDRCEEVTIEGKNYPGAAAKVSDPPLHPVINGGQLVIWKVKKMKG